MMKVNEIDWAPFKLSDIANIKSGQDIYDIQRLQGNIPYITSGTKQNGIGYFVGNDDGVFIHNTIVMNRNGAVGQAYYHPYTALMSNDCRSINITSHEADPYSKLFITKLLTCQKRCFSYSRKLGTARANNMRIMLPINEDRNPDFHYMSAYLYNHKQDMLDKYCFYAESQLSKLGNYKEIPNIEDLTWSDFSINDIFKINSGKRLTNSDKIPGIMPFIGAADNNNGLTGFIGNINSSLDHNVLGVNYNGNGMVIGFYHPYECVFTDDVKRFHLKNHEDNKFVLLFMKVAILQQKSKFGYLYKFNAKRMARTKIMLPVKSDGSPDYEYMEQYAKNIMIKKYNQYLEYRKNSEQQLGSA